ncbi:uncharacterized protein [Erythrolamprus reginae]|uniref:uncharacterized protein n=1 Tax=Erythrolamprus reginae TaxID=121349 RepID=UPI00396C90C4
MEAEKTVGLAGGKKSLDIVTKVQFLDFYLKGGGETPQGALIYLPQPGGPAVPQAVVLSGDDGLASLEIISEAWRCFAFSPPQHGKRRRGTVRPRKTPAIVGRLDLQRKPEVCTPQERSHPYMQIQAPLELCLNMAGDRAVDVTTSSTACHCGTFIQAKLHADVIAEDSQFCGLQYPDPKLDEANVISEYSGATEAPWLVNIYGNGQRCQGVILSSLWVLTAANCFLLMNPSQVELIGTPGHSSTKAVSRFVLHRGFSSWNTAPNNDLGLILLDQPVDLTAKDMWPACIPQEEKPYNTQEECRVFERGQEGSMRWFLKETMVEALSIFDCSTHWPNATEGRNLCVKNKGPPNEVTTCKVPVGSPVICHDPVTWEWEVMGLVSQSLHNCTIPILASQLLSHIEWLKKVGALENPLQTEIPSAAGQQQPATSLGPNTVQTPSATLQVPVILPAAKQIVKLPSSELAITASLPPVQATTTATTKSPSTNLPSLEATVAAVPSSSTTNPPTLKTIVIIEANKPLPEETTTATVTELPPTNLPLLGTTTTATSASPVIKPPAMETSTVTETIQLPSMEKTTGNVTELSSASLPLEATTTATTASPLTKPPSMETNTVTETTQLPSMETTTTATTKLPSASLPSLGATTTATTASPTSNPPSPETTATTSIQAATSTTTPSDRNDIELAMPTLAIPPQLAPTRSNTTLMEPSMKSTPLL